MSEKTSKTFSFPNMTIKMTAEEWEECRERLGHYQAQSLAAMKELDPYPVEVAILAMIGVTVTAVMDELRKDDA